MNKLFIIGNLTRDPETRTTRDGVTVCSFTVAVNKRHEGGPSTGSGYAAQSAADKAVFFRVSAWRGLGENCQKYLAKGRKVAVTGEVGVSVYKAQDGNTRAALEVNADEVEFLTPKAQQGGYEEVTGEELPWS